MPLLTSSSRVHYLSGGAHISSLHNVLSDPFLVVLPQVTLNQLALAPVTLAAVFTWNLTLTGQSSAIAGKIQRDLVPSMINGTCRGCSLVTPPVDLLQLCMSQVTTVLCMMCAPLLSSHGVSFCNTHAVGCAGWKFWVPAASLNFYAVPLQYQVGGSTLCSGLPAQVQWTPLEHACVSQVVMP
jgi:protein Mpv17